MMTFSSARKNMVDCQLATSGISDPYLLELMGALPREIFLPLEAQDKAYVDEDLVLPDGRVLMEPVIYGRMLQEAAPQRHEKALMIGDATGYAAALLSGFCAHVVTVEDRAGALDQAHHMWGEIGIENIAAVTGNGFMGCADYAPYDLIILHGAVTFVPEHILDQLAPNGRLVTVLRAPDENVGRITLIVRDAAGHFSVATLHDAATPYIAAFAPPPLFRFG